MKPTISFLYACTCALGLVSGNERHTQHKCMIFIFKWTCDAALKSQHSLRSVFSPLLNDYLTCSLKSSNLPPFLFTPSPYLTSPSADNCLILKWENKIYQLKLLSFSYNCFTKLPSIPSAKIGALLLYQRPIPSHSLGPQHHKDVPPLILFLHTYFFQLRLVLYHTLSWLLSLLISENALIKVTNILNHPVDPFFLHLTLPSHPSSWFTSITDYTTLLSMIPSVPGLFFPGTSADKSSIIRPQNSITHFASVLLKEDGQTLWGSSHLPFILRLLHLSPPLIIKIEASFFSTHILSHVIASIPVAFPQILMPPKCLSVAQISLLSNL